MKKQFLSKVKQDMLTPTPINTKKYGTLDKEYEFSRPANGEVIHILNDTIKDCKTKYFHSFKFRCVYDFKFINMENNEEVILTLNIGYMKFKSQFYGLNRKVKIERNNGFIFNGIVKLTIKTDSSMLSKIICYFLKLPIPK